jgi:imidazolonepropionase-like amidohydrolase
MTQVCPLSRAWMTLQALPTSELELYVAAGLKPAEVLKIATWNGAKYSQVLETSGSISPAKQVDLILADGDPSVNISDIHKVSMVMKSGLIFFPAELYEALGVKRFTEPPKMSKSGQAAK